MHAYNSRFLIAKGTTMSRLCLLMFGSALTLCASARGENFYVTSIEWLVDASDDIVLIDVDDDKTPNFRSAIKGRERAEDKDVPVLGKRVKDYDQRYRWNPGEEV